METAQYTVDLDAVMWALIAERPTQKVEEKLANIGAAINETGQAIRELATGSERQVPRRRTPPLPVRQQLPDATGDA